MRTVTMYSSGSLEVSATVDGSLELEFVTLECSLGLNADMLHDIAEMLHGNLSNVTTSIISQSPFLWDI